MKKILSKLCGGVLLFSLSMSLTSCEGALDDILGEWSRPTPGSSTGGAGTVTAATITTAPTATAGDILDGSTTELVTAGVADGGTMMYKATSDTDPKPTSTDGFSVEIPTAAGLAVGTYFVWYYAKAADAQHSDSEIAATPVKVTVQPSLSTPLTIEAITAGTIKVTSPNGMQYSLNGGAKKAVTTTPIDVAAGDKVAFYGNGTSITNYAFTQISGGTAKVKVYGNIMSLVDEENFATNYTTLPADNTFYELFKDNEKLTDASGLLLPAMTLADNCYESMFKGCTSLTTAPAELPATDLTGTDGCYSSMFAGCTILTTAPELKATTLASDCYICMFEFCKALTTAPELPATTLTNQCYVGMFQGCTSLSSVTCLATNLTATDCTFGWLNGVAASGTFTKASGADWSGKTGSAGIPSGWTVIEQ